MNKILDLTKYNLSNLREIRIFKYIHIFSFISDNRIWHIKKIFLKQIQIISKQECLIFIQRKNYKIHSEVEL